MSKASHIGIDARLWHETGVGRYVRNLVRYLQEIDIKNDYTLFVLPSAREEISNLITNPKWRLVEAPIRWHTVKEQVVFPRLLAKEHLDLVHFPYFSVPISYRQPFVVTIHDIILHHYPTGKASTLPSFVYWLKHTGYKHVIHQAAQKAQKVITVSHATQDEIVQDLHISKEKIVVTYEGVDTDLLNSTQKKNPVAAPYFLYVGNAYPHKNLERLLEGFALFLSTTKKDVKLVLVGKEDYFYRRLRQYVRALHLERAVMLTGHVDDETLSQYYQHALALVAPSLMEGFGLTPLEAMGEGCLVMASDIPAFHEICKDAAFYFDPFDTRAIAEALAQVEQGIVDGMLHKKRAGKERIQAFSWKKMAEETVAAYEDSISVRQS